LRDAVPFFTPFSLGKKKFKPRGVAGEDLVNVLEVNLAGRERYSPAAK
jgi:hypothetical protein